jgi:hypothetical protein
MTVGIEDLDAAIVRDHKMINKVYEVCRRMLGASADEAKKWKNLYVNEIARHLVAEELVLYPKLEILLSKEEADLRRQEHTKIKEELCKLDDIDIEDVHFSSQMDIVMHIFNQHCIPEEQDLQVFREKITPDKLEEMGKEFASQKTSVTTRPHPGASDKGSTLERVAVNVASPYDRLRDKMRSFPSNEELRHLLD